MKINQGHPVILKKGVTFNGFFIPRGSIGTVCQTAPQGVLVAFQVKSIYPLLGLNWEQVGKVYKG